jgi:hypothetical protein
LAERLQLRISEVKIAPRAPFFTKAPFPFNHLKLMALGILPHAAPTGIARKSRRKKEGPVSATTISSSRAVVVWQPRPTILARLKSIPPLAIVAAAGLATYAAVAFIAPSFAPLPKAAVVVADVPTTPAPTPPPSPKAVSVEDMPRPVIAPAIVRAPAPPPVAAAPANPVAFVEPLVAAVAPLVLMPRQNSALVMPREVARVVREVEPMMRPMRAFAPMNRAFAPMMRGGFPFQRFAGGFPRGGFGLGRGFGGFRLFRR